MAEETEFSIRLAHMGQSRRLRKRGVLPTSGGLDAKESARPGLAKRGAKEAGITTATQKGIA